MSALNGVIVVTVSCENASPVVNANSIVIVLVILMVPNGPGLRSAALICYLLIYNIHASKADCTLVRHCAKPFVICSRGAPPLVTSCC